jgi:hypothetical protein
MYILSTQNASQFLCSTHSWTLLQWPQFLLHSINILWYLPIPHKPCSVWHVTICTSDIGSSSICQEVGCFKTSAISLSFRTEALYSLRKLYKFQVCKMMTIAVIHFMHEVTLSLLNAPAEFQKVCTISNTPTGLYFVFQYFPVTSATHLAYSDTCLQHNLFCPSDDLTTEFNHTLRSLTNST